MTLRDYQIECRDKAVKILEDKKLVLLAMECRLGKTFVSLSVAKEINAKRVLFVTTKKAIPSIEHDYQLMKEDDGNIFHIHVTNYEDILAKYKAIDKKAILATNEAFPNVAKNGVKYKRLVADERRRIATTEFFNISKDGFDTIIIDECHKTGQFPKMTGCTTILKEISVGKNVILLSGTPNPESFSQFYHEFSISSFSPWNNYKNFYAWAKDHVNVKEKMVNGFKVADYSCGIESKITNIVSQYIVTYTQSKAGFSTKIDERIEKVLMSDTTLKYITRLKKDRVVDITLKDGQTVQVVTETPADLLNKIHQLSGGTIKIGDESYAIDDSKVNWIEENFHGKHFCIFYVYKAERDMLLRSFPFVTEDWQEFQRNPKTIFIGQIRSVREGLRLDTAEFSIFYSTEYSYVSYAQGINRIVSKERDTPAIVYFLTSQCKIEEQIMECVHNKKDFTLSTFRL